MVRRLRWTVVMMNWGNFLGWKEKSWKSHLTHKRLVILTSTSSFLIVVSWPNSFQSKMHLWTPSTNLVSLISTRLTGRVDVAKGNFIAFHIKRELLMNLWWQCLGILSSRGHEIFISRSWCRPRTPWTSGSHGPSCNPYQFSASLFSNLSPPPAASPCWASNGVLFSTWEASKGEDQAVN